MHRKTRQNPTSAAYTTEFHYEFQVETRRLLRRRFLWFTGVVGSLAVLSLIYGVVKVLTFAPSADSVTQTIEVFRDWRWWIMAVVWSGVFIAAFVYAAVKHLPDTTLLKLALWVVVVEGLIQVLSTVFHVPGALGLGGFFVIHFLACLFLPWTARQALVPMAIVLGFNVLAVLGVAHPVWRDSVGSGTIVLLAFSPLLAVPGVALCAMRSSKRMADFKHRFITSRYSEMRRELVDARKIHESLFPEPITAGDVLFAFEYEPMRQIGGDFLYAHRRKKQDMCSPLSVVLLDVTGHGIPAALTVNRLHGELERLFAEQPDICPGEVLSLLNRYVHLTLANHSIYVTVFCARIDPDRSVLEYASGGHPPAFVRAVDGTIEELQSTAIVLGACARADFEAGAREVRFGPGDTLIAYTDGAIEAIGQEGKMLRIEGLRQLVATADHNCPQRWPGLFGEQIAAFRDGPPADDTLFLTVHRPISSVMQGLGSHRAGQEQDQSALESTRREVSV